MGVDGTCRVERRRILAWRCQTASELAGRLDEAIRSDGPSLIALPIDYSAT